MRGSSLRSKAWRLAAATGLLASLTAVPAVAAAQTASAAPIPSSVQLTSSTSTSSGLAPGSIKHVWLIILENKSYDATFTGLNQNSYLWKTLPSQGVLLKNYYGTGHFSQDNYESMVSGQAPQQDTQSDCDVAYKNFGSSVDSNPNDPNYGQATSNQGAYTGLAQGADGTNGCVYPASVPTLFNQFDANGTTWKGYAQDAGNQPGREDLACFGPGSSAAANNPTTNPTNEQGAKPTGVTSYTGAQPNDQYVAKHFPFPWFHSLIDNSTDCNSQHISSLDNPTTGLVSDLQNNTAPNFSWITPNNCSDAHDAVCAGNNLSGAFNANGTPNYAPSGVTPYQPEQTTPTNYTGGLYASDLFLKYYIPLIESSQAFKQGGLIDVTFDEGNPPFTSGGGQSFNNADQYAPTSADKPNLATNLATDAAGENINGQNVNTEPAGPNVPLGINANGVANPGPGDSGFIDRTPAGARSDSGATGVQGQSLIYDNKISEYDNGRSVTGTNIPTGAYVANASDTGPVYTPSSSGSGGSAVMGTFSLVDVNGNPLTPTGNVSGVTLGAETAQTDPIYDPTDQTPGGGDTGSVLISPYITPGTSTTTYYNHYSWLRTMEDLFQVGSGTSTTPISGGAGSVSGGLDGLGHIGFAAQSGLRAFGPDVFNNPAGTTLPPVSTPEAPFAIGLPVAAVVIIGSFLLYRRRKAHQAVASS